MWYHVVPCVPGGLQHASVGCQSTRLSALATPSLSPVITGHACFSQIQQGEAAVAALLGEMGLARAEVRHIGMHSSRGLSYSLVVKCTLPILQISNCIFLLMRTLKSHLVCLRPRSSLWTQSHCGAVAHLWCFAYSWALHGHITTCRLACTYAGARCNLPSTINI